MNLVTKPKRRSTLPTCHTLTKQIAASFLPRVYCIGPCYRNEPNSVTHLDSFYQIEFEAVDFNLSQILRLARRFIVHVLTTTSGLPDIRQDLSKPSWRTIDFPTAQPNVRSWAAYEEYIADVLDRNTSHFVWIVHPPAEVQPGNKRFRRWWADGFELFAPHHRGELASGGIRDRRYSKGHIGQWSPAAARCLPPVSGGFGVGVERLVGLLSNSSDLREVRLPHTRDLAKSLGGG